MLEAERPGIVAAAADNDTGGAVRITNREIYTLALETRDRTLDIQRDVADLKVQGGTLAAKTEAHDLRIRKVEDAQDRARSIRAFAGWLVSPAVILTAAFIGSRFK